MQKTLAAGWLPAKPPPERLKTGTGNIADASVVTLQLLA
jgi:hypothetical protein